MFAYVLIVLLLDSKASTESSLKLMSERYLEVFSQTPVSDEEVVGIRNANSQIRVSVNGCLPNVLYPSIQLQVSSHVS